MLTDIRLQNFRSYRDSSFELSPGVNIIVGPNASGKTNLLEAVLVLCAGRSYRAADSELPRRGAKWARLDAHTPKGGRSVIFKQSAPAISKQFIIDDITKRRLTIDKSLPVVLFEPNHLGLVHGEPALRRDFLDNLLERLEADFSDARARYARALRQRNALLKRGRATAKELFPWNLRLSELGGQIVASRLRLIGNIGRQLAATYADLARQPSALKLNYISRLPLQDYASQLLKKLEMAVETDILRGFTLHGPHRDDLEINLDKAPMSQQASRGEVRTLLLALKIMELKLLEAQHGQKPLLLLDDVFSELDGRRRRAVAEFFKNYQTFITTTDADIVAKHFVQNFNLIPTKSA